MIEKILERLERKCDVIHTSEEYIPFSNRLVKSRSYFEKDYDTKISIKDAIEIVQEVAKEHNNGWIPCSERLPKCENEYGWVNCIVSVIRSHYPTSTYDVCDSPYDENIVMHAQFNAFQKIWHLECDEQLNALIDIEDAPLNGDYVVAWQPLPVPYQKGE